MTDWIGAAEAAERLGIKQASLYAYVSRGVLSRRREADGRASMFDADEVEELARKGRPRRASRPAGSAELVIESELTELTPSTQRYRGYGATELALRCSFEDVAVLLWSWLAAGGLRGGGRSWWLVWWLAGHGRGTRGRARGSGRPAAGHPAAGAAPGDRAGARGDRPAPAASGPACRRGRGQVPDRRHGRRAAEDFGCWSC